MAFSGKVGDTFVLKDNPPFSNLYVILTAPNDNGKIVVVGFTRALYAVQNHIVFTEKDDGRLFRGRTTIRYTDATFRDHQKIVDYQNGNPEKCKGDCPNDIIREIVAGAFQAQQSPCNILDELARQYPDIVNPKPS